MKLAILLAFLGACGTSSPDPHKVVACEGYTATNLDSCEAACATAGSGAGEVPAGDGSACDRAVDGTLPADANETSCPRTLEWNGERGCCVSFAFACNNGSSSCPPNDVLYRPSFFVCQ